MHAREDPADPSSSTITLDPLYTDGPDALDTHDIPPIASARLTEIEIRWANMAYGITIRKADDLFAPQPPGGTLVPPAGAITRATFDVLFADSPRPHKVTIEPPQRLTLEFPTDAPRVLPWLDKRHFRIPANILRTSAAILLAIASALAPASDDDDGDGDDISAERNAFCA